MKDQSHRKRKVRLDTHFILLKRTITKITRRKVPKENTKNNKWNRKYRENGHRKNIKTGNSFRAHYFRPNEERKRNRQSTQAAKSTQSIDIVYGAWTESTDAGMKYSVTF